jgi:hypothetical protein
MTCFGGRRALVRSIIGKKRTSTRLREDVVIPAQAGIHLDLFLHVEVHSFHSACGRAGSFSLCGQREVTKRKATPGGAVSRHPAFRLREGAPGFAGCTSFNIPPTAAQRARPPSDGSCAPSPRHRGPRLGGILPQKPEQRGAKIFSSSPRSSAGMHGFVDPGAVRGAEHRRRGGKCPQGRGDGSPRLRSSTRMYCLSNPATARSAGQSDSQEANQTTASGA